MNWQDHTPWQPAMIKIVDGKAVRFSDTCVHTFHVSDTEDPEIYAAGPILDWQQTDAGKWVMENAVEQPYYVRAVDNVTWGYQYRIIARLSEQNQTFWSLKWGGNKK